MNELTKHTGALGVPSGLSWRERNEVRAVISKVRIDGLKMQGDASLVGLQMDLTVEVNRRRATLAAQHPEIADLLTADLVLFHNSATRLIETRHSLFGRLF